jgi:VWFA-related protein
MRGRVLDAFIVLSAATMLLTAQTAAPPQQPTPTFRAGIDVVQLDVSVLDKNRRPIKGLTAGDFTVLENGKPQSIVAFDEVEIPGAVESTAPWMRDVASDVSTNDLATRRVVIIVLDDAYMPFDPGVSKFAKQIAHSVVDDLGPDDLAAVTFTFLGKKQDITRDRARLGAAVDSLVPHGGGIGCTYRGQYGCVVDTLVHVADALLSAPMGRKTLVYISPGVPYNFSMENLELDRDIRGLQTMFRNLQEANVNVYAVDPSGLTMEGIIGARQDALRMFAENTGGRATLGTNTPWEAVPQIFRENSSYYLLGFRSANPTANGRFRRIEVRVNRPNADVRTRSGYYAPTTEKPSRKPAPVLTPTDKALSGGLPAGDLTFAASAVPVYVSGQRESAVAVTIGLREPLDDRSGRTAVKVTAAAFDPNDNWKQRGESHGTFDLNVPAAQGQELQYDLRQKLMIRPGHYQLRVAVEQNGQAGSVFLDLDVPDYARALLTASGLVLATDPPQPSFSAPDVAGLLPLAATTLREFRPAGRVTAFVRLYQGGSKPPAAVRVMSTILDEANRTNFEQTTVFESARFSGRAFDYTLELPLSKLEGGAHLLTIEAGLGRSSIKRQARFVIR